MKNNYIISATTENTLRVLQRMAGVFARQRVNIDQLSVYETSLPGVSRLHITVHSDERVMHRVLNQLERIIEVIEINIAQQHPFNSLREHNDEYNEIRRH